MQNYLKLLSFLKGHRSIFSVAVVTMFIASILEGATLSLFVPMIDIVFNKKQIVPPTKLPGFLADLVAYVNGIDPDTMLKMLPVVVFCIILVKHGFVYCYQYFMNDVSQRVLRDVRDKLYDKIQSLSLDYFSVKRTGELVSRITHDVQIIENAVSYGVTDLFRQTFLVFIYISIAFSIHPVAALIIFFVMPTIGYPIARIGKKLKKLAKSSQERMADINSILLETISGVKVVKAFCSEAFEKKRFEGKNRDYYKLKMKSVKRLLLISPITELTSVLAGITIFYWLGSQVKSGDLSLGIFVLFFGSIMSVISPFKKLGNVNALTQRALSANERIYDILDQKPSVEEKENAVDIPIFKNKISLQNISFGYDEESGIVLKNIDLQINKGELIAIVGPTGVGKTTLVNLIPRFYDPTQGVVTIDGVDLRDVSFRSLRLQIGIVSQETFLFNDTVKANIMYGARTASHTEVEQAAKRAYAQQFIQEMPNGYDTIIGDRGFRLSGGERQRIAIARAILKNPSILILDEATSALDSQSEKYVQDALDELMRGRTVIAIAHRLSTIKKANRIVVLDEGKIVGKGKHEELLADDGLYNQLYKTQFHA